MSDDITQVEELEEKLQLLRTNTVPIEEYKQLSEGILNECASVQKNAMQNISERCPLDFPGAGSDGVWCDLQVPKARGSDCNSGA
eukprot:758328-Hanusia_phi.AAC.6